MASGDFHDSDFHSGDFHFSSDFSSGDYSGGSYDSGFDSDGNPCRGRREPTKFDLVVTKIYFLILLPLLAIFYLYYYAAQGKVMGLNTINLTIFVVAGVLFALSLWHSVRTSALVKLRRDGTSDDYVFSAKNTGDWTGTPNALAGKDNKIYRIAFNDMEYGPKNCSEVLRVMESTPSIIWIRPGTWFFISVVLFFVNFLFYECVIPTFENMRMSDAAFRFFDVLTFYLPSFLALACSVLSLVFVFVRDNILYECAVRLASEIETDKKMIETRNIYKKEISKKWYHNICPNCGAKADVPLKHCVSCGSSLEVLSDDKNLNSIRRAKYVENELDSDLLKGEKDG